MKDNILEKFFREKTSFKITRKQLKAMKLRAAGFEDKDIAKKTEINVTNLPRLFETFNRNYILIQHIIADTKERGYVIESASQRVEKSKKMAREKAKSGRHPGGQPLYGAILKDGWYFPKKDGEYERLLEILQYYAGGKLPTWISRKFEMQGYKIKARKIKRIVRDIRYDNRFIFEGKERKGDWPRLVTEKLWKKVQSRYRPAFNRDPIFPYEWINKKRHINSERAAVCKRVVKRYLNGEPSFKIIEDEKISSPLFYSILSNEVRTGWIMKDDKLVPSGHPRVISREDWKKVQKIRKSKERWEDLKKERVDGMKQIKGEIRNLIPGYRREIMEKIPERSFGRLYQITREMKEDKELREREDGLLYFYGVPPSLKEFPMRLTKEQKGFKKIENLMPAYRWQILERLKMKSTTMHKRVSKMKRMDILRERNGLLQKVGQPFPERLVETSFKRTSERRRKVLDILLEEEKMTQKDLAKKTGLNFNTLQWHIRKLINEEFLERKDGKLQLISQA